ncbi:MAG: hypothetical protein AABZ39_00370 [Spirochaetota bacterium]
MRAFAIAVIVVLLQTGCMYTDHGRTNPIDPGSTNYIPASHWTLMPTSPSPVHIGAGHAAVSYKNEIWVIGGSSNAANAMNEVRRSSGGPSWISGNNLPTTLWLHAAVVFRGAVWVVHGSYGSGSRTNIMLYSTGGGWGSFSPVPDNKRYGHAVVVYKNKLWMIGGDTGASPLRTNDVWATSDGTNWNLVTASASFLPRAGHRAFVWDDKIWIVGGCDSSPPYFSDIYWSTDGVNWTAAPPMPFARSYPAVVVINNRIVVIGGETNASAPVKDIWYTPDPSATGSWRQVQSPFTTNFSRQSSLMFNDKVWMIGGANGSSPYTNNNVWWSY